MHSYIEANKWSSAQEKHAKVPGTWVQSRDHNDDADDTCDCATNNMPAVLHVSSRRPRDCTGGDVSKDVRRGLDEIRHEV